MAFKMKPGSHPMQKTGGGIPQSMLSRPMMKSGPYQKYNQSSSTTVGEYGPEVMTPSKTKRQTNDFTSTRTITTNKSGGGGDNTPPLTGTTPFGNAFKKARKSGASEFNFKGKDYTTEMKGDSTRKESRTRSVTTPIKTPTIKPAGIKPIKGKNISSISGELATTGLRKPLNVPTYPAKPKIESKPDLPGTVVSRTVGKIVDGGEDLFEDIGDGFRGATREVGKALGWVGRGLGRLVPRRRGGASCPSGGF
tara:strand:- start:6 stop:758 length:753 start_codon:yes stop_codon:yes gene_type:complete